jgi:hypothetical protein
MLAAALLAEVGAYVEAHRGEVDELGHRLVVRNGFHEPREVSTPLVIVLVDVTLRRVRQVGGGAKSSHHYGPKWSHLRLSLSARGAYGMRGSV